MRSTLEVQRLLIFDFTKDLDKLFEAARYIVRIRELRKLPSNLLSLHKGQLWVLSHLKIVRVAVLVSPDNQVDVVSQSPPSRRALSIEN